MISAKAIAGVDCVEKSSDKQLFLVENLISLCLLSENVLLAHGSTRKDKAATFKPDERIYYIPMYFCFSVNYREFSSHQNPEATSRCSRHNKRESCITQHKNKHKING